MVESEIDVYFIWSLSQRRIKELLHVQSNDAKIICDVLRNRNDKIDEDILDELQIDEITDLFNDIILEICKIKLNKVRKYWLNYKFYGILISKLALDRLQKQIDCKNKLKKKRQKVIINKNNYQKNQEKMKQKSKNYYQQNQGEFGRTDEFSKLIEKKDDIIDSGKNAIIAAGAGVGIILVLFLIVNRRGGD